MLAIWKMGDFCIKAHLHVSVQAEGFFFFVGRGEQNKEIKGGS